MYMYMFLSFCLSYSSLHHLPLFYSFFIPLQVSYVVDQGCIGPMCVMLGSEDPMVIQVILDGLGNILKMAGPRFRIIADVIEEVGGVERIEALQEHQNQEIYKMAYFIIDRYFNDTVSVIINVLFLILLLLVLS